jgi:hypothetical protein
MSREMHRARQAQYDASHGKTWKPDVYREATAASPDNDESPQEGERAFSQSSAEAFERAHATLDDSHHATIALICPTCESDKLVPMPDGTVRCRWNECAASFASLEAAAKVREANA